MGKDACSPLHCSAVPLSGKLETAQISISGGLIAANRNSAQTKSLKDRLALAIQQVCPTVMEENQMHKEAVWHPRRARWPGAGRYVHLPPAGCLLIPHHPNGVSSCSY